MQRPLFHVISKCFNATALALFFLLPAYSLGQDSRFLFDLNGNLTAQMADTIAPPQITGQPLNQTPASGKTAAFSVIVADPRSLTYQWRFNGGDIGGANGGSLLIQNVSTNDEGVYDVVLTNPSGSVTSAPAFLMIDEDGDHMGDSWETNYFTNLDQYATADFDGDGVPNIREFQDHTDPTDPNSARYRLVLVREGTVLQTPDAPSYNKGELVTLTATNGIFHAWLGDVVSRENPLTIEMTNDMTIYARFTPITFTWVNPTSGDWQTAANWDPGLVPGTDDSVNINTGVTVTLNTNADCSEVTLGAAAPTLTGSGTLTIRDNFSWTAGAMSGNGKTVLETNNILNIVGSVGLNGRTLENGGTILWDGTGLFGMGGGAVITNRPGALFRAENISPASIGGGIANGRFDNAGIFQKATNTALLNISGGLNFNNTGTVETESDTLLWGGGFTNNGAVVLSPGTTNRFTAGGAANGTFNVPAAALVEWTGGTFTLNPGAQFIGDGLYRINGNVAVVGNGDVTIPNLDLVNSSSTLGGTGVVAVASAMNWTAGTMEGTGRTLVSPGATIQISGVSLKRTLENGGTALLNGSGGIIFLNGIVTNRPGALFEVQNASTFFNAGGGWFDNAGIFRKSVDPGTYVLDSGIVFNNSGTVEIQTGALRLGGGGSASGTFDAPAGTSLEWTGGTYTLEPGAQLNGDGLYQLSGASRLTQNADFTVENLDLTTGTLDGSGTMTIGTAMNWLAGTMSGGGRTIIAPGATLNLPGTSGVSLGRTLENGGTVLWTNGNVSMGIITNRPGAVFDVRGANSFTFFAANPRFDNAGTFRKSVNTGTTTVGPIFNNSGTVEIQTGTLVCNGSFTNNGTVSLSPGTTNRLAAGGSASGTFATSAASLVEWTGFSQQFTLHTGAELNGTGLYRITNGWLTADTDVAIENLDLAKGTLDGAGTLTVADTMTWGGGSMSGTGRTIISPSATLSVNSPSGVTLNRTLENGGTVLWTGPGAIFLTSAVITNRPDSLFHVQNSAAFAEIGTSRFDNAGTFRKSVSTGTTSVGMNFNNYGRVDLRSGIVSMDRGYASSSNAVLNCSLGGTSAGTDYGQLQKSGTITLGGALSVDLLPGYTPATNDAFTVVTAGTRSGTFSNFAYPDNRVTMQMSNTPTSVVLTTTTVFPVPQPVLFTPEIFGSNALLTWTATSNVTYQLEQVGDLASTNWTALPGDVTTTSNTASKLDLLTASNRLYRVHVLP